MHICLICVEIFAWGKYGGFGRATRLIGRELVRKGIQVSAIVPRRRNQRPLEILDGIEVHSFNVLDFKETLDIFRKVDADIFHSQEPSFGTYLGLRYHPNKKHMITFRDTRLQEDWLTEFRYPSLNHLQVVMNWLYEDNPFTHWAVRKADAHFVAANLLISRAQQKYHLINPPVFLPTPVEIPNSVKKAERPTVCYLSRWDRRKRPEFFFALAEKFPGVRFLAVGKSRNKIYDKNLRKKNQHLPNLEMPGFINQFDSSAVSDLLGQSWILVNTAVREGLPNSFIEACAHHCAILSSVNPDEFATRFGVYVEDEQFESGLRQLLTNDQWKEKAEQGYQFIHDIFSLEKSIAQHIHIYEKKLNRKV